LISELIIAKWALFDVFKLTASVDATKAVMPTKMSEESFPIIAGWMTCRATAPVSQQSSARKPLGC